MLFCCYFFLITNFSLTENITLLKEEAVSGVIIFSRLMFQSVTEHTVRTVIQIAVRETVRTITLLVTPRQESALEDVDQDG